MNYNWIHLFGKKGDHRYFRAEDGRIGIADDSGHFPEHTDDGVMFVDTDRPILSLDQYFSVPLVDEDGKESRTFASPVEGLCLAALTGQPIGSETELFAVTKIN